MKILYIAPENTVGTLNLWQKAHEARGNECRFVTLYRAKHDYDPGLCLNLPLVKANQFYMGARHWYYQRFRGEMGDYAEREGYPPVWKPNFGLEQTYFQFRDWLWHFKVEPVIAQNGLLDYDIIHLEWGLEFYRDGRFVRRLHELGKSIVCTYHGQDLRTRGVIPAIDSSSGLNVTSELDLLSKHPNINYLFLPFDTSQFSPNYELHDPIRICHSPTNRFYKGSETIIQVCEQLSRTENIEFILVENKPFEEVRAIKQECDILIDQVHNRGGWGYGMNSVEALSLGLCCVTELVPRYIDFIPDHPFVNVNGDTLFDTLKNLVRDNDKIMEYKHRSREWVVKYHDLHNTAAVLYSYYNDRGWI
ncbi:MAG: glycosyltransferase [Candidatus Marinimicrobia bacterium]|nr:glycosyltransferase [Candidatus Neomarinimicrobiota bacterium]